MDQFVAIGLYYVPELFQAIAKDANGAVASNVSKTVRQISGENDAVAAKAKIANDPQLEQKVKTDLEAIKSKAGHPTPDAATNMRDGVRGCQCKRGKGCLGVAEQ